ncbi:uncharacterized mitochondrial protein-like protein [Tanacetum coccineum]
MPVPEVITGSREVITFVPEVSTATPEDLMGPIPTSEDTQDGNFSVQTAKVWVLIDLPKGHRAIGTKCVYRNKKDERGIVIRNKARLVAQGHTQEEGIDYDEKELCEEFEKLVKDKFSDDVLWEILTFLFRVKVSPKTSHLLAVKRIFRYLKGKPSLGLWYSKDSPLELVAYTDSDYAGATIDRKYTTT